ncbi:MAG TPA: O-antigen ligase family protein [Vicinamibacterales bacterium]|nr:O-antigen ligase family protein [Vicinamibacterales bacterium]
MIRAARVLVVVSTAVAALVEAFLAATYTPQVFWIGMIGFALMLIYGRRLRSTAMPVLMAALYLTPAILNLAFNAVDYGLDSIWILPLLGVILSDRSALDWSLPDSWRAPLITWSVLVAIAWPIVFLRETDFAPWILPLPRVSNTSIGTPPAFVDQSIAYFALLHNAGILFVDALCRWYRGELQRFRREVLLPMLFAAGIAAPVAVYQGFFDLGFLNTGFWEYMIRASGTLADPNKLGAVAGFWTVGALVVARRAQRPWNVAIAIAGLVLGITAAWLSGSRTGLASVGLSVTIAALEAMRWVKLDVRKLLIAAVAALVIGVALIAVLQKASTHTIVQRGTLGYVPFFGDRGIRASANELLWDRYGYGPAAIQMIKEHPLDGVGLGTYHTLSYDFGREAGRIIPAQDNAQAWWRHHLAELGLLGCIPLLWWCIVFGRSLLSAPAAGDRLTIGMLRAVLVAFFVASLFGVPSQSAAITLTFWVFVFWFALERGGEVVAQPAQTKQWPLPLAIFTVALIAAHAGVTVVDAFGDLRPRNRAQRWDWYYRYGFFTNDSDGADLEKDPGGNPIGRRWTMKDSLAVIKVKGKTLKFVAWVDHPDVDAKPVHARVWADSKLVYEGDLKRAPLMLDIPATPGKTHMVIETSIDRVWRPSDFGTRDRRALGLSIRDWTWE